VHPQRRSVRCECSVDTQARKTFDKFGEVCSDEWLSTGQTNTVETEVLDADSGESFDFFEGKDFFPWKPLHSFCWHAVLASEITAIRDRNAEIANGATERVD
tara:strand:- start:766 stop:1071 length:306 start_codon:yes stop_codon:yes gene_type:complete